MGRDKDVSTFLKFLDDNFNEGGVDVVDDKVYTYLSKMKEGNAIPPHQERGGTV